MFLRVTSPLPHYCPTNGGGAERRSNGGNEGYHNRSAGRGASACGQAIRGLDQRYARPGDARRGEGSRPWSAGAGASVTTAALAVVTYTLAGLHRGLSEAAASTDISALPIRPGDTPFFEAFVTAAAKGADHADDALIATREMSDLLSGDRPYRSAIDEPEVFQSAGGEPAARRLVVGPGGSVSSVPVRPVGV